MLAFSGIYSLQGGEFWKIFLVDPDTQQLEQLPVPQARECTHPLWSPNRQSLIFNAAKREINGASSIYLFDISQQELHQLMPDAPSVYPLGWTLDSQAIAFFETINNAQFISLLGIDANTIQHRFNITDWLSYTWSPTWSYFAFVPKFDDTHIYIVNSNGSGQRRLSPESLLFVNNLSWSPNAKYLAFTTYEDEHIYLNILDIHTAERVRFGEVAYEVQYAWSPNGSNIAYLGYSDQHFALLSVSVADGTTVKLAEIHTGDESGEIRPTNPVWSADSQEVAFSTFDETLVFRIYRVDTRGGMTRAVTPDTPTFDLIYDLAWY